MKQSNDIWILIIGSRNMITPSGEWKLISERAKSIKAVMGISSKMLNITKDRMPLIQDVLPKMEGLEIINYSFINPWGFISAFIRLFRKANKVIKEDRIGIIILSAAISYLFWPFIKRKGLKVGVDIHGPLEEWLEYPPSSLRMRPLAKYSYKIFKYLEKYIIKRCEFCIVVSEPLRKYIIKEYDKKEVLIIPCGLCSILEDDEIIKFRNHWRNQLNIDNETLFVYCGGLSKWQLVDKCCIIFKDLQRWFCPSKLLLITPNPLAAKDIAISSGLKESEVICEYIKPERIKEILCAGDIGLLIREKSITNYMAFPNKFADYMNSGLIIITTSGLGVPSKIVRDSHIGIVISNKGLNVVKNDIRELLDIYYKRKSNLHAYYNMTRTVVSFSVDMKKHVNQFIKLVLPSEGKHSPHS